MFKVFVIGILIGVLSVVAGAWLYFTKGWAPVAVADPPLLFEKKLSHGALNARIGKDPHTDPAPVPLTEATYLAGADVYKQNCAVCHGLPGEPQSAIGQGWGNMPCPMALCGSPGNPWQTAQFCLYTSAPAR